MEFCVVAKSFLGMSLRNGPILPTIKIIVQAVLCSILFSSLKDAKLTCHFVMLQTFTSLIPWIVVIHVAKQQKA